MKPDPDLTPTTNNAIERSHSRILDGIIETCRQKGSSGPHCEGDFHAWWPPATSTPNASGLLPNEPNIYNAISQWAINNNLGYIYNLAKLEYRFYAK